MKPLSLLILLALALTACAAPATPGSDATRGEVYVDSATLLVMESFPIQLSLVVAGNLPTGCHTLQHEIAAVDAENRIQVSLWSEIDPAVMCTQALQPFDEGIRIPLDGLPDGEYSVWLNGQLVGEFRYPG